MEPADVASVLDETALYLELAGENPFRVRSYRRAAETVAETKEDLVQLHITGKLQTIKGVGKGIARDIDEIVDLGSSSLLRELKERVPAGVVEMTRIRGLGVRRVRAIHEALNVSTLTELEYACLENRLVTLKGFGPKMQASVLEELDRLKSYRGLYHIHNARHFLRLAREFLETCPGVRQVVTSGAVRRRCEVVKTGCLVVASDDPEGTITAFMSFDQLKAVIRAKANRANVILVGEFPVEIHAVLPSELSAALLRTTGSPAHVAALDERAADLGFTLEAGVLKKAGAPAEVEGEDGFYAALRLDPIPPELREGAGEVEATAEGGLPPLVALDDLKGALHVHTDWSDGSASIEAMALATRDRGFEYVAITDHSRTAWYASGLSTEKLLEQGEEIDRLNERLDGIRILKGIESDILPDGSLDYPDDVLERLDLVVASVHGSFSMKRDEMTGRLLRAIEHPATRILGHPTGRLLLGREGYPFDVEAVLARAAELGVLIEINANPYRLDLDWRHLGLCRTLGTGVAIDPDAHSIAGLDHVEYGVAVARKGWLGVDHVANCLSADALLALRRS